MPPMAAAAAAFLKPKPSPSSSSHNHQCLRRLMTKVRLKWIKSRGMDHIIDRDTDIKAAVLLKDAILRSPSSLLSSRSLSPLQKPLGLTVPVLRFLRRYPTLFQESPHPRYPSLPSFSLSPAASLLHSRESSIHLSHLPDAADRLAKLLMMTRSRMLPVANLYPLRYDLGLPDDFPKSVVAVRPDLFESTRRHRDGACCVSLAGWPQHLAVSALQQRHQDAVANPSYRDFKKSSFSSSSPLAFPMSFPKGYGSMKKVKAWMEEFHRLPYVSPYEDCSGIDPDSDLMEKRVVGVLHELLSLTIHKKTKRNYLRCLREEMSLPHKFTRVFTRYPGIFYLSLKCKTTTVMLREAYQRGKLVDPHPLASLRDKYFYVMRTGVLYRGKGLTRLVLDEENFVGSDGGEGVRDGRIEENDEDGSNGGDGDGDGDDDNEYYEVDSSDLDDSGSDED